MTFVEREGIRIHYESVGEGPTVVLQTGAGGDSEMWRLAGYVEGLPGFRKILLDQRGRGRSDRPPELAAHRMEEFVADVEAVLDDAGVESAAIWGYSAGVRVGIAFGAAHPTRLRALLGTGGLRYRDMTELPRVDVATEIAKDVARGGVSAELDEHREREHDEFPEAIDRNVRAGDPLMHALDSVAWLDWRGPKSALAGLRAPWLMISGEREDPDRFTEQSVAAVPGARVVRIPGVGHLGAFYRSGPALAEALPFLRTHLSRT